jgi:hypothetical protein
MHFEFACLVYNQLTDGPTVEVVNEMISDTVTIEKRFINGMSQSFAVGILLTRPCVDCYIDPRWIGMNIDNVLLFVEFVADDLLVCLHQGNLYNTKNPVRFRLICVHHAELIYTYHAFSSSHSRAISLNGPHFLYIGEVHGWI